MMKQLTLFLLLMTGILVAEAQSNNIIKDSIIAKFNKGDMNAIYAMADTSFKEAVKEEQLVNLLKGASGFGKILSAAFISTDSNNVSSYKLVLKEKSLLLNIRAASSYSFDHLGLSFYKLPIERTRLQFWSDNAMKSKLDSVVQHAVTLYMSNKNVAGLSVGILQNGASHVYNFGETKKGSGQVPTANTLYEIGSVTKTFTGLLLAKAIIQGKVKPEDDIRKYLPGNYPNVEFAGHPIQLVHLSNHTSRLPSQPRMPQTNEDPFNPSLKFTDSLLSHILREITIDTLPGTRRQYSNFAVGLLGIILEKVYGMEYEQLLKKYILSPYGMKQTGISLSKDDFKTLSQGYDVEGNAASYWRNRIAEPAGGIRSTIHDMLLYMNAQLNTKDSAACLSHKITFGDTKRGTGLNWGVSTTKEGHLRWAHDGGTDGFTSLCLIYPELNSGIILFTNNGDHEDQSFYDIAKSIYSGWLK